MTSHERKMLIEDCREACRHNVLRTDEERREVREKAVEAARRLGLSHYEDAVLSDQEYDQKRRESWQDQND